MMYLHHPFCVWIGVFCGFLQRGIRGLDRRGGGDVLGKAARRGVVQEGSQEG